MGGRGCGGIYDGERGDEGREDAKKEANCVRCNNDEGREVALMEEKRDDIHLHLG